MWSDNESEIDLLRFDYLATAVSRIVVQEVLLPTTIGVFGDWGSGKSTLLGMVRKQVEADEKALCITFNGWMFEGYEDAKTALMGTILDAIEERVQAQKTLPEKTADLLQRMRKRVNWLQLATLAGRYAGPALLGHPHLSAAVAVHDVAKSVYTGLTQVKKDERLTVEEIRAVENAAPSGADNHRKDIRDFRHDFGDLLAQADIRKLIVFIDDLDRCLPDTIIATLEAIKLFLFVPGTAFVIGADERLIQYAVRHRFPELPGTETEIGRDYLEKLIQVPVRIPPLSSGEIHSYINLLFAQSRLDPSSYERVCQHVAAFAPDDMSALPFDAPVAQRLAASDSALAALLEDLDFAAQTAPILAPGMGGNPRRTKRFLNALLLRLELGDARRLALKRQVLAKLMLLEYLKPEFFKQLAKLQAGQSGQAEQISFAEAALRSEGGRSEGDANTRRADASKRADGKAGEPPARIAPPDPPMPAEVQSWLVDEWMRHWLESEPALSGVDLRPYFYIAHDTIGVLPTTAQRLSPRAQEVVRRLLDAQPLTQRMGLEAARALVPMDAAAVFEHLALRVRQTETLQDNQSPHHVLFKLVDARPELGTQLVSLFDSLPESKIILALPGLLYEVLKGNPAAPAARSLLQKWSGGTTNLLAGAARQAAGRKWE